MTRKLPSFFKETIEKMLNLCLAVYIRVIILLEYEYDSCFTLRAKWCTGYFAECVPSENSDK